MSMTRVTDNHDASNLDSDSHSEPAIADLRRALPVALVTGVLMVLSFPVKYFGLPEFHLDLLIWVTLVPLFLAARGAGGKRGFLLGYAAGLVLEAGGFYWICQAIAEFSGFGGSLFVVALALFLGWLIYTALIWGALGWLLGRCRTPAAIHLVLPIWVGLENYFPRIFPWHIGGVLHDCEWLRQAADLFGASGLTYVILLANVAIVLVLEWRRGRRRFPRWTVGTVVVLILGLNVYGALRLRGIERATEAVEPIRIGLLQPNLDPRIKGREFPQILETVREHAVQESPDLILLPEGMDRGRFELDAAGNPVGYRTADGPTALDEISVPLIFGGSSVSSRQRYLNTAAYILPPDTTGPRVFLAHKNRLLLFGERVPLEDYLPEWFRKRMGVGTMEAGIECPVFTLSLRAGESRFSILICYEAVLPDFMRQVAGKVDFLANITEDLWYGRTSHVGQHVSVLRMRAVECRTPIVRCANGGPSGVVTATGAFDDRTLPYRREWIIVGLRPARFYSLYRAGGCWFPLAALVVATCAFVVRVRFGLQDS